MNEDRDLLEITGESEQVFKGILLDVRRDTVTLPDGNPAVREIIRHPGAVAIVPLTEDGRVIVERQFRYPLGEVITEIPAGKLDSKTEDLLEASIRELREETGYTAEEWTPLGWYYPAAGYSDERIMMYLAEGLSRGERDLDEDEFINVAAVPLKDLVEGIMKGEIPDGKTQAALLRVFLMRG